MVKYLIKFDTSIREGQVIVDCIGLFDSVLEADDWYEAQRWAIVMPDYTVLAILVKQDEARS